MNPALWWESIRRFGSPQYLYDLGAVRRASSAFREALPDGSKLYYSVKANPLPSLLRELSILGHPFEVSSQGELDALTAAGVVSLSEVLHTGPGKTADEIEDALRRGVQRFSVESLVQADLVNKTAAGRDHESMLRLAQVGIGGAGLQMTGRPTQFGLTLDEARTAITKLATNGGQLRGLHIYTASNIQDSAQLIDDFSSRAMAAQKLTEEMALDVDELALGGGFPAPYGQPGLELILPQMRPTLECELEAAWPSGPERPQISFESGRALIGSAGTLLAKVVDVKERGRRTFIVTESGINHIGGMSGVRRTLRPTVMPVFVSAQGAIRPSGGDTSVSVVGPLCTPSDVVASDVAASGVEVGDLMAISNMGAYGATASLANFLSRPQPLEVVLDEGEIVEVTRTISVRQSIFDLTSSRQGSS